MLKQGIMQLKREFWENKTFIFNTPLIFSGLFICIFMFAMGYFIVNDKVHFQMTGGLTLQAKQVETQLVFDGPSISPSLINEERLSPKNIEGFSEADYVFKKQLLGIREANPELNIYQDSSSRIRRSEHEYKDLIESRLSVIVNLFETMLMGLIFFLYIKVISADRKDKSVLFWRSLPLSETYVLLAKFITAFVITPLIYFICLYSVLGVSLGAFAILESLMSSVGNYELTQIFYDTYINIISMLGSFVFQVLWLLPLCILVGIFITLSTRYGMPILLTTCAVIIGVENFILQSNYIGSTALEYYNYGTEATLNTKFNILWQGAYPSINFLWLSYCITASILLTAVMIFCRKMQQF